MNGHTAQLTLVLGTTSPQSTPSATGTTLSANNFRFLLPIPDTELKSNKSITQNPGILNYAFRIKNLTRSYNN